MRFSTIVSVVTLVWGISPRQPSGKNIIRWLLKKRTNGSVRYCQYTSVPYTATADDVAPTGQQIWQELQSGKWGEIAPFTVTPEMLEAAREARRQEIEAWRAEQEAKPFTFEWNGRIWNAGPDSLGRLSPVVMLAKSVTAQTHMAWSDADNQQVKLSMPELEELAAAMVQAQVDRNDEIYRRQREMKEELSGLDDLASIRAFDVE
ncbi:prophage tail protein [Shigella flexneri]|nr:prophage tail protein [Shigella flexneri]